MLRSLAAVCLLAAVWLSSSWPAPATSADPPPAFAAEASAITVDVVVEGPDRRPVRDLTREDFLVLEDGRAQTIIGFEARDTKRHDVSAETSRAPASLVGASNRDPERQPRRVFALLVDDLGLSALAAERVKAVMDGWLRAGAQPLDEITIVTTSGDVFWSDLAGDGLADLLLALARVRGKAFPSGSGETMSDFEAYRVAVFEESTEGLIDPLARSRPPDVAGTVRAGLQGNMFFVSTLEGQSIVERVTQRWIRSHVCPPCVDPAEMSADCVEIRACRQRVQSRAREQYSAWRRRVSSLHDSVSRLARALSGAPGRKAILLVSEELLEDTSLPLTRRTADACQRANAVLYFLGARGLTGSSLFSAEADAAPRPQDVGAISREEGFLAVAGGVALAEETGGLAVTSNDLATGLSQMASDSSSYYLLGFQSDKAPDDRWRSLKVQVKRPGARVRARPRYLAAATQDQPPARAKQKRTERSLDPALLAGISRGELPVRMTAYVQDPRPDDGVARVQIALEIDNHRVRIDRSLSPWKGTLDLTIMTAGLTRPLQVPIDERLELSLESDQVDSGWWLVPREVWLPPGVSQVRVLVRDAASGASGLVTERVVVPDLHQAYISTPTVTDRTFSGSSPRGLPRLAPAAHRTFGQRPEIFFEFEVYAYGGWTLPGVGQLVASHTLRRVDGALIGAAPSLPIDTADGRAVRRITLPVKSLDDGAYELSVTVQDRLAERTLTARSTFEVLRGAPPAGE